MYGFQAPYAHNYGRTTQNGFGGINANKSADNGEVLSLLDMTSDEYPLLATRPQRWRCGKYDGSIVGYGVSNGVKTFVTKNGDNFKFHYGDEAFEFTADESLDKISIAAVGDYIILLPVMKFYDIRGYHVFSRKVEDYINNTTGNGQLKQTITYEEDEVLKTHTFKDGEFFYVEPDPSDPENALVGLNCFINGGASFVNRKFDDMRGSVGGTVSITNGRYAGEPATGNVITVNPDYSWKYFWRDSHSTPFRAGDAIKISGFSNKAYNKTVVIREIDDNGKLIFSDNTFEMPEGQTQVLEKDITLERDVPDIDIMFSHNNRVWGAKGRNIYCTKAGNPLIWSDYESLGDGCWWADTGNTEPYGITGGCSYTYPRFFSEKCIYTIYGDTPGEFTIVPTQAHGVLYGSNESLAVVNGMLVYLSPNGFVAYTGSLPQKLDYNLGNERIEKARSISDGIKYYTYAKHGDGMHLYVYDPARGMWEEERANADIEALWHIEDLSMACDGHFWTMGKIKERPIDEGETGEYFGDTPKGKVVFADVTMDSVNKKQLKEICIRHEGKLTVRLYTDGELDNSFTKTVSADKKQTTVLPCVPKRCDHWHIELEGEGPWVVYSIAVSYLEGSAKK